MIRIVALLFILAIGLIVGCSNNDKTASSGVLDVSTSPPPVVAPMSAPIPSAEPIAAAPAPETVQIAYTAPTPVTGPIASPAPAAAAGKKTYTVQKGDSLFGIAKKNYGTGREWQKIASANPGLTPANLKAGQKIVIP